MLWRHGEPCLSIYLRARSVVVGSDRPDSRATSQARKGRWGSRSFGRGAFVHSSFCALCAHLSRVRVWSRFGFKRVACYIIRLIVIANNNIREIDFRSLQILMLCRKKNVHRLSVRKQFEREECFERYWSLKLQHGSSISIKKL